MDLPYWNIESKISAWSVGRWRLPPQKAQQAKVQWQQLTPEQLISHVLANTVFARWLARRFGVHALIRVCDQHSSVGDGMDERPRYGREVVIGEFSPLLRRQPEESANLSTLF
jgi:hypothetical protein